MKLCEIGLEPALVPIARDGGRTGREWQDVRRDIRHEAEGQGARVPHRLWSCLKTQWRMGLAENGVEG
jgi:hypothetical protein